MRARACGVVTAEWLPRCRSERCRDNVSGLGVGRETAARRAVYTRHGGGTVFLNSRVLSSLPPMAYAKPSSPNNDHDGDVNTLPPRTLRQSAMHIMRDARATDTAPPATDAIPPPFFQPTDKIFSTDLRDPRTNDDFYRTVCPQF